MTEATKLQIEKIINEIFGTIDREREREIVARRFGLFDRKETLEQIGELLGITRERVRQLEKAVVARLKAHADGGQLPHVAMVQDAFIELLGNMGNVARVSDIASKLTATNTRIDQSRVSFLAQLCPKLVVVDDNDFYYHAVGLSAVHDEKTIKKQVEQIITAVKAIGEPATIEDSRRICKDYDVKHAAALASTSKPLATLNGRWGLIKWPMVNPKEHSRQNIRYSKRTAANTCTLTK